MIAGVASALIGILLITVTLKGMSINNKTTYLLGADFLIVGILIVIFETLDYSKGSMCSLALGFGGVFIWAGIFNAYKKFKCTMKIEGVYLGSDLYRGGNSMDRYSPKFKFLVNGIQYKNISGEVFRKRYVNKRFQVGNTYKIYVNPKNPNKFVTRKRIALSELNLVVMGVIFISVAVNLIFQ